MERGINFGLFFFNLLPIPPLDGSHFYMTFLKDISPKLLRNLYMFGTYGLLLIILIQNNTKIEILPLASLIKGATNFGIALLQFR